MSPNANPRPGCSWLSRAFSRVWALPRRRAKSAHAGSQAARSPGHMLAPAIASLLDVRL